LLKKIICRKSQTAHSERPGGRGAGEREGADYWYRYTVAHKCIIFLSEGKNLGEKIFRKVKLETCSKSFS
jgi:hypothetical protein